MLVKEFLDEVSAKYNLTKHSPTFTAQRMAAEEHVSGRKVAKPVVIEADGDYYICVIAACSKVDLQALKNELGAEKIGLADETVMASLFPDCQIGAEPPLGVMYGLTTIMDKELEKYDFIVFQGGTHEDAITMSMSEYKRLTSPRILKISYPAG